MAKSAGRNVSKLPSKLLKSIKDSSIDYGYFKKSMRDRMSRNTKNIDNDGSLDKNLEDATKEDLERPYTPNYADIPERT